MKKTAGKTTARNRNSTKRTRRRWQKARPRKGAAIGSKKAAADKEQASTQQPARSGKRARKSNRASARKDLLSGTARRPGQQAGSDRLTTELAEVVQSGFARFGLKPSTLEALRKVGYFRPSSIQERFIPLALTARDCVGQARTGTGKTAAFVIPILERVDAGLCKPQALVLAPTRELTEQVAGEAERLASTSPCRICCVVGGRRLGPQIQKLRAGVHIVIGTPGRILDLLHRGVLQLGALKIIVLDEADRMLDIGFRPDIERILRHCPKKKQTLLLSATMPPPVEELARRYMTDPVRVDVSGDRVASEQVEQYYITVDEDRKFGLLIRLLAEQRPRQVIVFTRTKARAEQLYRRFAGKLPQVAHLHGDLPQKQRDRAMRRFREGQIRMLIATDVAGRGLDVSGVSHIINYDIPEYCDDYVHRVGRTGRMNSDERGYAFTFVTREQGEELTRIEMRINCQLKKYEVTGYEAYRPGPEPKTAAPLDTNRAYIVLRDPA